MAESMTTDFSNMDLDTDATSVSGSVELEITVQNLIDRCKTLHDEVETYVAAVIAKQKQTRVQHPVEYRNLRTDFKNELAFLNRIVGANMDEAKARHFIVSSNLLYYEALWAAAKRASGRNTTKGKGGAAKGKTNALADIVAGEGGQWLRVSTLSEKRLLFDLAKLGWMNDSDSDDDMPDAKPACDDDDDDEDQVDIVRNARQLARAARANPIRGRPPKVHFVLTRIVAGKTKEIDGILDKIRATGATIQCANDMPPTPPLEVALPNLLIDRSRAMSDVLNIDCTILLALISDISHHDCPVLEWYPGEVRAQIAEEAQEHLLPTHLYPAIASHSMVTTTEAVDQMYLIVDTLATDAEKTRADLLLARGEHEGKSREQLVAEWQAISNYPTSEGFQLPIRAVPSKIDESMDQLPAVARELGKELGALNKAIFLYGWVEGLTTLSANRGRARQIETILNEWGLEDGEQGPHIWICGESRSLIAKHGRRR